MRQLLVLTLALALGAGLALADGDGEEEETKKKKKTKAERIEEQKRRKAEQRKKAAEKRAKQKEEAQKRAEERFKKQDSRTKWDVAIKIRSKKKSANLGEDLAKMNPIDEASVEGSKVALVLASSAKIKLLGELNKRLAKNGAMLDERNLRLPKHFVVNLKGELRGTKFQRKMGRKRGFKYTDGQKLLAALKQVDGIRNVTYPTASSIKIGCDRNVKWLTIKGLIAQHGNKGDGSAYVSDVIIEGSRQVAKKPESMKERGRGNKKKGGEEEMEDDLK